MDALAWAEFLLFSWIGLVAIFVGVVLIGASIYAWKDF